MNNKVQDSELRTPGLKLSKAVKVDESTPSFSLDIFAVSTYSREQKD
jgi:hypothetical protein